MFDNNIPQHLIECGSDIQGCQNSTLNQITGLDNRAWRPIKGYSIGGTPNILMIIDQASISTIGPLTW